MRLFQVYKLSGGRRSFVARVAVPSREDVARSLPPLADEEAYESAVECTDPHEYRQAIENYEEQIVREHLPEKRSELREIITGLRNTVAMMDQIDGP